VYCDVEVMLLAFPGELTTMAGRRLRETVKSVGEEQGQSIVPIIAGTWRHTPQSYVVDDI
jgi:hypothetical protein